MSSIRTIVVDDEPLARKRITRLLTGRDDFELIAECRTGKEASQAVTDLDPDLVFLDIQMPGMDGFDVLQAIDLDDPPVIVFVTAYDEYAVRAFDHHALDYLLKPFDDERFDQALDRVRSELRRDDAEDLRSRLVQMLREHETRVEGEGMEDGNGAGSGQRPLERIVVRTGDRILFIKTEDIDWIEAADYYAKIHVGDDAYLLRESLTKLEEQLDSRRFARIHRSSIVNLDRVLELQPWFNGAFVVILKDGTQLRLSRGRRENLEDLIGRSL